MGIVRTGKLGINLEMLTWAERTTEGGLICHFVGGESLTLGNEDAETLQPYLTAEFQHMQRTLIMQQKASQDFADMAAVGSDEASAPFGKTKTLAGASGAR